MKCVAWHQQYMNRSTTTPRPRSETLLQLQNVSSFLPLAICIYSETVNFIELIGKEGSTSQ